MFLTPKQVAEYLAVSENWLSARLAAGDSVLSPHLKLRHEGHARVARQRDRVPVRIHIDALARYVLLNHRDHSHADFPLPEEITDDEIEGKRREILAWKHETARLKAKGRGESAAPPSESASSVSARP